MIVESRAKTESRCRSRPLLSSFENTQIADCFLTSLCQRLYRHVRLLLGPTIIYVKERLELAAYAYKKKKRHHEIQRHEEFLSSHLEESI